MITIETPRLRIRTFCTDDWRELQEMIVTYQESEYARYDQLWSLGLRLPHAGHHHP
jgi:hypothetical protein